MADALDDIRCKEAAKHEAGRPGRADQAKDGGGIALGRASDRQKQALQAVAQEEKQRAQQERGDGEQVISHHPSENRSAVSKLGRCALNCQPDSVRPVIANRRRKQ
ncbi:hypothetical protein D3C87_1828690 [compost metagenome]